MPRDAGKQAAELVAARHFHVAAPDRGGHLVGFVADDQVPVGDAELVEQVLVAGQLVEPRNGEARFLKHVAGRGGFDALVAEYLEAQVELAEKLVLPLFGQRTGADDETALEVAARDKFLDEQAGHDGLARAGVIRKDVAQGQTPQKFLIDGGNLMRERLDIGRVDGEIRVEEVGVVDAPRLGRKAELCAVGIEAPRQFGLLERERGLVFPVEKASARRAPAVLIGDIQNGVAVPLGRHDSYGFLRCDAENTAADGEFFKLCHGTSARGWRFPSCMFPTSYLC